GSAVRLFASGRAPGHRGIDDGLRELPMGPPPAAAVDAPPASLRDFDPASPDVRRDAHPHYHRLRAIGPVHHLPRVGYWLVLGHAEVTEVLKEPAVFSSLILKTFDPTLIGADPPVHTRVRRLVTEAFTPRRTAALESHMRARAAELVDAAASKGAF